MDRRDFLKTSTSCGAHMLGLSLFAPKMFQQVLSPQDKDDVVAEEKWGRLEKIHDGVFSLISTPFTTQDFTTVCNGGIIAGDKGVLAVESFMQPIGATWLAEQAKRLTGRWPTDIVSTHFHADHTGGHLGYYTENQKPRLWLTESTKDAAEASFVERKMKDNGFKNVELIDGEKGATIDLGNRQVNLVPRSGHTPSDVTVELVEPKVVWCGDLFFNQVFPNYGDAIPSRLREYSETIIEASDVVYVPGHGPIADLDSLKKYKEFLAWIENQATSAFKLGNEIEVVTKDFKLPDEFSEWLVWSPENAKKAYAAWFRELKANDQ